MPEPLKPSFLDRLRLPGRIREIVRAVIAAGGRPLLVGGGVRDLALGREPKDVDIEVHDLSLDALETVLLGFGAVDLVGKQFGVLRIHGTDADWSVPRTDSKGRKPEVTPDPFMGIEAAARRRDLTVNAMAVDLERGTLLDPFGGLEDLRAGRLCAVDPAFFAEDPLRFFRVMAFAGRLEMIPDEALTALCASMDLSGIAGERIDDEFTKLFLKSARPSLGLSWLKATGRLGEVLPGLERLEAVEQDPGWHPEGNVWIHTMQVVDAAAKLRRSDLEMDLMLLWAAICHDLGKADTTSVENGRIRSLGHEERSAELADELLRSRVTRAAVRTGAVKLVGAHLRPQDFQSNRAGPGAFKRLALALAPETTLDHLADLVLADARGRNPDSDVPLEDADSVATWFRERARELAVDREPETPVLLGRHLLDRMPPGPGLGKLLKRAYEIQIGEGIRDREALRARVLDEGDPPETGE